jgi:hypothetical protein
MSQDDALTVNQERLEDWIRDAVATLFELGGQLGVEPTEAMSDPGLLLPRMDKLLRDETLDEDDRRWAWTQLVPLIGEYLARSQKGRWTVDDDPDSPSYTRYVIDTGSRRYDPVPIVEAYLDESPPRDLMRHLP